MKDSYHCEQLKDIDLALACTSDEQVNRQIAEDCRKRGILVNAASDKNLCDFQFPGILLEEEVTIAFNSSGKDHQKVKQLRQEVAVCLKCRDKKKGGAV